MRGTTFLLSMDKQVTMVDCSSVPLFRAFCCQAQVSKTGQELAVPVVPDSTEMEKGGGGQKAKRL